MTTLERVTVNLTTRAVTALNDASERAGLNKTDIINRAIQTYNIIDAIQHDGGAVYVRDANSTTMEKLRIF